MVVYEVTNFHSCFKRNYLDEETWFFLIEYIFLRQEKIILVKKILDCLHLDQHFLDSMLILQEHFNLGIKIENRAQNTCIQNLWNDSYLLALAF